MEKGVSQKTVANASILREGNTTESYWSKELRRALRNTGLAAAAILLSSSFALAQQRPLAFVSAADGTDKTEAHASIANTVQPTALNAPVWCLQVGVSLSSNTKIISYDITADDRFKGGWLVNGATTAKDWAQIGLTNDWPKPDGTIAKGFMILYQTWSPTTEITSGYKHAATLIDINSMLVKGGRPDDQIKNNDKLTASLYIDHEKDKVFMVINAKKWKQPLVLSIPAHGATEFVGSEDTPMPLGGRSSGVMLEGHSTDLTKKISVELKFEPSVANLANVNTWKYVIEYNTATKEQRIKEFLPPSYDRIAAPKDFNIAETQLRNGTVIIGPK